MSNPDVIVTGTGRSGTSTIARLLHIELGVCMGHKFRPPHETPESNPNGEYEDTDIALATRLLSGGYPVARPLPGRHALSKWVQAFKRSHQNCTSPLKGAKTPHFSGISLEHWELIKPRAVVIAQRPIAMTVASMERYRGAHHDWKAFYEDRQRRINEFCAERVCPYVVLDFSRPRSDENLLIQLKHHLGWLL